MDAIFIAHVKSHWRWKLLRKGCAVAKVAIKWND